ncbi:site-2 protease family protein [Candidatus Gracilibacteria bacterium]|nr:site-2 protease family protein [Candidatus Gracilibacteria bacterium]
MAILLQFVWQLLSFLFVLSVLVFVHELGHFLVARWCGVKVEEFAFGLPPRIWGKKYGETTYAINLIPFGGYVKMLGQHDFDADAATEGITPRHFESKTWWQKSLILCAGVTMNMILAMVILSVGYMIGMKPFLPQSPLFAQAIEQQGVGVHQITADSVAAKAGVVINSKIEKVNDTVITSTDQFKATLDQVKTTGFTLLLSTEEGEQTVTVPAQSADTVLGIGYGGLATLKNVQLPWYQAIYYGATDSVIALKETFLGLGRVVSSIISEGQVGQEVTGPVGIFKITSEVSKDGLIPFMQLMALLSISLAAMNILPIPALDGGRLLFVWIEALVGKKRWNKAWEGRIHLVGMALLLLLMVVISARDIGKLF